MVNEMNANEWIGQMIVKYNLTVESPSEFAVQEKVPGANKWWVHMDIPLRNGSDEVVDTEAKTAKNLDLVAAIEEVTGEDFEDA